MGTLEDVEFDETTVVDPAAIYKFDEAFQTKIAALCVRDTTFLQRTDGLIRPDYLENAIEGALVHVALSYFTKYKKAPGDMKTFAHLIQKAKINKVVKPEMAAAMAKALKPLYGADVSDRDLVIDEVATFARHQAVSKAILESVEHLDLHEFDKISSSLKKALDVGEHGDAVTYSYADSIEARTQERLDRAAGKLPPTGITTGFSEIDRHLYHKGWGRRELSVLMGGAKAGKTTALIDFGVNAAGHIHRYNVLYVTLEVSAKIIAERMDANISDRAMMELDTHIHEVREKVEKFVKRAGRFDIKEFPTGTMRVSDLRRYLEKMKGQGVIYDLVIVDYADLMAPERVTDNSIENSKSVYVALRGLAMQENIAVLTATQTNREGAKKAVATMTDIAEDFNKVRIADIIISINKTEEERALKQCRLYFAACRNQAAGFSIRIAQDIDRMKFISEVIGPE